MASTILITGANGQLGYQLSNLLLDDSSFRVIRTDNNMTGNNLLDITDPAHTKQFIEKTAPDWIVNCAGYTAVDRAEEESEAAMKINRDGVANLAGAARATGAKLIHISTDFVFDGKKSTPYTEDDPVSPVSAYGRSKAEGEAEAMKYRMAMVIRTSWLYSAYGSNFVKTILKLSSERDELRVVADQTGTPTNAEDLTAAIVKIIRDVENGEAPFHNGILNYSNSGSCSWYEFAQAITADEPRKAKIIPVTTAEYPVAARRPAMSVMNTNKIKRLYGVNIPPWEKSLKLTLENIKNIKNER
ncbi:MAG: dTDP-4-dehydrorhamnose reductase [Bacteroidales bacterium]